ncbi:MAG: CDP-alcohol phosphatidyltransferase family protein [Candidatus Hermodarchaeota archaeon]
MIDKWLSKPKINEFFEKISRKWFLGKLSANSITLLAFLTGILGAIFIFLSGFLIWEIELLICAVSLMSISFFLDVLDGALARAAGTTIFGGILDILSDRMVEVSIIISIISADRYKLLWPGIFSLASIIMCITMFLLVGGAVKAENLEETKKVIFYRSGLMERGETFIILILVTILIPWRAIILWIFAILVLLTAFLRLKDAYSLFKDEKSANESI